MAEILSASTQSDNVPAAPAGWWPVDYMITGYYVATSLLVAVHYSAVPNAVALIGLHALGIVLIAAAARSRPTPLVWNFRHWYPLLYVAWCFKEMAILIPAIRRADLDRELAAIDFNFWGAHPSVWLERIQSPVLTEYLQIIYTLFIPAVLLVPWLFWVRRRFADFRFCAFLIALGFIVSYVGYFIVPARGPRFLLSHLQHIPLQGLWLFQAMQHTLDRLESAHYDCFPSGHTEMTILAWWTARRISKRLFQVYSVYTLCIIFATVYLRYHYTVDIVAGVLTAAILLALTPRIYRERGT